MTRNTGAGRVGITDEGRARLRKAIDEGPLSQSEVARRAGVPQAAIRDILTGRVRTVPTDRATEIAHTLNLHLGDVFDLPGTPIIRQG
jgi:transcriptional regulator with XRE-family HTH domain